MEPAELSALAYRPLRVIARAGLRNAEMRCFGGFSEPEIARALDISPRTVRRAWEKARLLLAQVLLD